MPNVRKRARRLGADIADPFFNGIRARDGFILKREEVGRRQISFISTRIDIGRRIESRNQRYVVARRRGVFTSLRPHTRKT
ncbi:MAG: hypothetical protein Q4B35_05885 [Slackia sp.]|nr:hypothetical protein [Slackia sp.]